MDTYDDEPYRGNITADTTPTFRKSLEGNVPLPGWDVSLVGYMHNNVHAWVSRIFLILDGMYQLISS